MLGGDSEAGYQLELNLTSSSGTGSLSRISGYDGGSTGSSATGGPGCCKHSTLPAERTEKEITSLLQLFN